MRQKRVEQGDSVIQIIGGRINLVSILAGISKVKKLAADAADAAKKAEKPPGRREPRRQTSEDGPPSYKHLKAGKFVPPSAADLKKYERDLRKIRKDVEKRAKEQGLPVRRILNMSPLGDKPDFHAEDIKGGLVKGHYRKVLERTMGPQLGTEIDWRLWPNSPLSKLLDKAHAEEDALQQATAMAKAQAWHRREDIIKKIAKDTADKKLGGRKYMFLNREYDGLLPSVRRKERLKGKKSKFYPVFVGRDTKTTKARPGAPKKKATGGLSVTNTGRTGRFGHSDYRRNK